MLQRLTSHSPDLQRLVDDGYDLEIGAGHLLVRNIPYVNTKGEIRYGTLVSELTLAGDSTKKPGTHVTHFVGEHPCHRSREEISEIKHQTAKRDLGDGLIIDHSFSSKPAAGYIDYYEKMTTYIAIISSPAQSIDPNATPRIYQVSETDEVESVFNYLDTASSRAGISKITNKLSLGKIGIVGLGGTGSYVLDLVAKTPVEEIHLYDGDKFFQHNAFRSPGAPSVEVLREHLPKVQYFHGLYSKMHRGIVPHEYYIDASNVDELKELEFVFLCLDKGSQKKVIVDRLETSGISFIDVGLGIETFEDSLLGIVRTSTCTPEYPISEGRISFSDGVDDDYSQNIQIADLNALSAAFAVVKWKKLYKFYLDIDQERFSSYTISGNTLINEDKP